MKFVFFSLFFVGYRRLAAIMLRKGKRRQKENKRNVFSLLANTTINLFVKEIDWLIGVGLSSCSGAASLFFSLNEGASSTGHLFNEREVEWIYGSEINLISFHHSTHNWIVGNEWNGFNWIERQSGLHCFQPLIKFSFTLCSRSAEEEHNTPLSEPVPELIFWFGKLMLRWNELNKFISNWVSPR